MSSAPQEIENSLLLRSYFLEGSDEATTAKYDTVREVSKETFADGTTLNLCQSVQGLVAGLGLAEDAELDSHVGQLLSGLDESVNIPSVAASVKYIFDHCANVPTSVEVAIVDEDSAFVFALAVAVATTSIVRVASEKQEIPEGALAHALLEQFRVTPPKPPLFEFHEEMFLPYAHNFDVERIIRMNSEFEDHNIEALRHKSFTATKENNSAFSDMSRSLASFVWAINLTIDIHKDETFVYDFSRIGTEHIARTARSWGIKDIDSLEKTIEAIMKGIGTVYDSEEKNYTYPVPNLASETYLDFRYLFNVALAAIASAHVFLFATNFDSTQEGVYGEVRRTIKEVQDNIAKSA